jgi:hypothetical protein
MLKLVSLNLTPRPKPIENLPWSLIQLATLNGLTPGDIVKLAKERKNG